MSWRRLAAHAAPRQPHAEPGAQADQRDAEHRPHRIAGLGHEVESEHATEQRADERTNDAAGRVGQAFNPCTLALVAHAAGGQRVWLRPALRAFTSLAELR